MGLLGNKSDQFGAMNSLLGIDPAVMRRQALFNGLAAAGFTLMGDKNLGNAGGAFLQGTNQGRDAYMNTALDAYRLKTAEEEKAYRRQQDEENKRRYEAEFGLKKEAYDRDSWRFGQEQDAAELAESQRLGQQSSVNQWTQGFEQQGGNLFSPEMQMGLRQQGIQGVNPQDTQKYNKMQPYMAAQDYGGAFQQMTAEPAAPEAPQIQKFREVDPVTGEPVEITAQWSNGQWVEIGRGPAFNPKSGVTVNNLPAGQDPPDADLRKKLSEKEAETWTNYTVAADQSGALVQQLQIVDELAKTAPQGPISGRLATMFPGVSTSGDAFNSIVTRIAPSLRTPGSGSQSDREFEAFLTSMPRLQNTPGGNAIISAVLQAKAELDVRRGDIVSAYSNGEISAVEARKQLGALRRESILTPEMQQIIDGASGAITTEDGYTIEPVE
jgi:hypothetical protein